MGLLQFLNNTEEVNKFIDDNNIEKIKSILPYKEFEKNFYDNNLIENNISNFQSSYIVEIDGRTVGINCLNTAWRCYNSKTDKGKIILGERQISEGYKVIEKCDVKIALMHHQIDWLANFDRESIENLIHKYYDAVFCGHVHKGSSWSKTRSYGELFVSIAPQNWAGNIRSNDRVYSNGYSILDYDIDLGKIAVNYRRYSKDALDYVTNTDLGNDGKDEFEIKIKADIKKKSLNTLDNSIKQEMKVVNLERDDGSYFKNSNILNEFMIEKNVYEIGFVKHKFIIKENLQIISKYSVRYEELINNLDLIFILIDKLIYRLALDNNNNEYINTMIDLGGYFCKISNDNENKVNILNQVYTSICWFWSKIANDIIPRIFNGEITIPNLVNHIINLEGSDCVDDQYIKVLIEAKQTYIALHSGNDYEVRKNSDISLKCQIILCIILPVYLYKKEIMNWTSELEIGEFEDIEMDQLLRIVKDEYLNLQSSFVERNISIDSISNNVKENKITIIKGKSGSGKSTVIAKIIEKLSTEKYGNAFSSSIIIHSFKHSKNIHDLVNSIVKQCNSKLINKINIKILDEIQTEYNFWANNQTKLNKNKFNSIYDIYKKVIREVVNNFIIEHGEIYIFIDSSELANIYENEIENLFIDLPINSHIVISTSENNEGIYRLASDQAVEKNIIKIDYLSLEEIPLILNLSYGDEENTEIIDKIYQKTKGNISLIKDLLKRANISGMNILDFFKSNTTEFDEENVKRFNSLANKWILFSTDTLEETLLILSIFESINFISFDKLQSFLNYKGYNIRLPKIKKFLSKVDEQIVCINNKIKLSNKEFAEFIVNKFFSKTDIEKFIGDLFNWICKCIENEYNFTVDFFKCLIKQNLIDELLFKNNLNSFIDQKKNNNEGKYLFNIGLLMYNENKDMVKYSLKMIESAVELNNSEAKGFLGYCFLKGKHIDQNVFRGEALLNEACESGNIIAKSILGKMLIEGDCVSRNVDRGMKLLFDASTEGDINAKLSLSIILITGRGIKSNPIKGRELLYELIKDNNTSAMLLMGSLMIDGVFMERNRDKGLRLINKAIENGSLEAKLQLAKRLIGGNGVEIDKSNGFRLLKEMLNSGSIEAKRTFAKISVIEGNIKRGCQLFQELIRDKDSDSILVYSKLILDGKLPQENKQRAIELLEKEVENKNVDAMRELGKRLLEGNGVQRNIEEGIRLLEHAISRVDVESMRELGYKLANGIDGIKNKERGEMLLLNAAERGDIASKVLYALILINNYTDQYKKSKGLRLLEEAVSYGNVYAKLKLSSILFNGNLIKKDVKRAVQLLEDCIVSGDSQAARVLGFRLLNGINVKHDINRAKELLINAMNNDDSLAKTIFGEAIILGYFKDYTMEYGIELLEKGIPKEHMAEKVLGTLLIKGINIDQDKIRGEVLLRNAAEKDNIAAMRELYNMLLDGRYLEENINDGKIYLNKAIEANDDVAKIEFAERLLDGNKLPKDPTEGKNIFNELIIKSNSEAMIKYGQRLILGDGVIKDKLRGEKLLRESIVLGNTDAKRNLALNIINGTIDTSSKDEAIKLLEDNVLEFDEMTMITYGEMLIDGDKIGADLSRGIKLMEKCCEFKNPIGKYSFGKRLIEGNNVDQNIERGLTLLQDASSEENEMSNIYLAQLYIDGKYLTKNIDKGIELLNNLILNGNEEAQRILAHRLIKGNSVKRDKDRGVYLFNNLIERKNFDAMDEYGDMLLNGFYVERDSARGQKLLNCAIKNGDYYASYVLGKKLLSGKGIKKHKSRGIKELKKAARHDIVSSEFEYGVRLKSGVDIVMNVKEGKSIIENILAKSDMKKKYSLGVIAYELKDFELATKLFYDVYINKAEEASSVSLAYMLRRNEIKGEINLPDIHELLEKSIKNKDHNAYINLALYYIRKDEKNQDWQKVDKIFKSLCYCGEAAEWWYEISKQGDLEGELVLGLMDRYGLISDLSDTSFVERFKKVNKNGWDIPNWMFEEITAYEEIASTEE